MSVIVRWTQSSSMKALGKAAKRGFIGQRMNLREAR
jgi:hypothetical protein